jgi:hypothetical protein
MVRRSTWIMLGIFVLLVGFAVVFQRYQTKQAENAPTATPTVPPVYLLSLGDAQVNDIKIADSTGSYIDLYLDPTSSKWAIEGVPTDQADSSKIEGIGTQLLSLQVQEALTETISLSAIGLDTPSYTITVTTASNSQSVTYVGMQTAIGSGYYVRENDGPVMIVSKSELDQIINVLKEPPLLPTATPEVTPTETLVPTAPTIPETPTP